MNNSILEQDIKEFCSNFMLDRDRLSNNHICVTGATGLIGSVLVKCLLALSENITITVPVRDKAKALRIMGINTNQLNIIECDLLEWCTTIKNKFDYIIHCASPTSGMYISQFPVETYNITHDVTLALLEYSRKYAVKSFVYISSIEYYGQILEDKLVTEDVIGRIDSLDNRSAYPMGKRSAEFLCTIYAHEYNVPVKIARLTQTFGAGVSPKDNRVFAQFARSIIEGNDIVLHTTGESAKPYCYTMDCVSAILYILIKGKDGEAYNVANPDTYISIKKLAYFLCENFNKGIKVRIEQHPELGYAPVTKLRLSTQKLEALGWRPQYGLTEMFTNLIAYLKEDARDVH